MRKIDRDSSGSMTPGQDLVVVGAIGTAGTRQLLMEKNTVLQQWFSHDYLIKIKQTLMPVLNLEPAWLEWPGITEYELVGEGGILAALWNLSGGHEQGIGFNLRWIPIRQGTIEICERLELNPYRLWSGECWILVADNGGQVVRRMQQQGITAAVIGEVKQGIKREIYQPEGIGYLERPQPDELWKVIDITQSI